MPMLRSVFLLALLATAVAAAPDLRYIECCDASAGVALSADLFVVGNDEDNVLRIYRRGTGGRPVSTLRLDTFLGVSEETDFEDAARIGDRIYWIGSHGRNKKGKPRPARQRFFATDVRGTAAAPTLVTAGKACTSLLPALIADPKLAGLKLAQAEPLAPEAPGGLNIEALCARPDGTLLIGFRNPIPGGHAILVPLLNPGPLVQAGAPPIFGDPIRLDLGGRGLRGMQRLASGRVLILAGPPADSGSFAVHEWSGVTGEPVKQLTVPLGDLRPEAIVEFPDGVLMLISDDGGVATGGVECKDLPDPGARGFRSRIIEPAAR